MSNYRETTNRPSSICSDDDSTECERQSSETRSSASRRGSKGGKERDIEPHWGASGRWIARGLNPTANVLMVLLVGCNVILGLEDQEGLDLANKLSLNREHQDEFKCMTAGKVDELTRQARVLAICTYIAHILTKVVNRTQSDDTTGLKNAIEKYAMKNPKTESLQPPLSRTNKANWGFNHPQLARLLCPAKYIMKYNEDPARGLGTERWRNAYRAREKLRCGDFKVTARQWPYFLYDENEFDPDDVEKGLLLGHALKRVLQHVLTSSSLALVDVHAGAAGSRSHNAALHNMTSLTPYVIAYVALQVRFAMSSTERWTNGVADRAFNYQDFYFAIADCLEEGLKSEPQDKWAVETMKKLNKSVFGHEDGQRVNRSGDDSDSDSDCNMERMRAACKVCEQQGSRSADIRTPELPPATRAPLPMTPIGDEYDVPSPEAFEDEIDGAELPSVSERRGLPTENGPARFRLKRKKAPLAEDVPDKEHVTALSEPTMAQGKRACGADKVHQDPVQAEKRSRTTQKATSKGKRKTK
ncbi:hypothetical protein CERSUDRAFT_70035 [Gelatoporia subvermispora B]|uniref:Uncharacterized protein n=1 Tax=Ceriporiopsis subvermispora (strain B) TaxID=914234 RepID=M2PXB7_CERS8|nr:hypothetical protein CERSUDRAFT_70035 [Gelatoporia subvermispora B]